MNRYEIRITGELGARRRQDLGCMPGGPTDDGTCLVTPPLDQAALYGLLARLRDMGAELVSVERIAPSPKETH